MQTRPHGVPGAMTMKPRTEELDVVKTVATPEKTVHGHVRERLWLRCRPRRSRTRGCEQAEHSRDNGSAQDRPGAHALDRRRFPSNAIACLSCLDQLPGHLVGRASSISTLTWFRLVMTGSRPWRRASLSAARPRATVRRFSTGRRMSMTTCL